MSEAEELLLDEHGEASDASVVLVQHQLGQRGHLWRSVPPVAACTTHCSEFHAATTELSAGTYSRAGRGRTVNEDGGLFVHAERHAGGGSQDEGQVIEPLGPLEVGQPRRGERGGGRGGGRHERESGGRRGG